MSFFIGFVPDENSNKEIENCVDSVKDVFDGLGIDVRWSSSKAYHLTLVYLGERVGFLKMLYIKYKLKKFNFSNFNIQLGGVKMGSSRRYRELIFLEVFKGGDSMRKLCLTLRSLLGLRKDLNFIPHLTLGRVNKDLTPQEYSNIVKDLSIISKKITRKNMSFTVNNIDIIKVDAGSYQILFSISSV